MGNVIAAAACPRCGIEYTPPDPVPGLTRRRITTWQKCDGCEAEIRLCTYEGWERWYSMDWRAPSSDGLSWSAWHPHEREAFYSRADSGKLRLMA